MLIGILFCAKLSVRIICCDWNHGTVPQQAKKEKWIWAKRTGQLSQSPMDGFPVAIKQARLILRQEKLTSGKSRKSGDLH